MTANSINRLIDLLLNAIEDAREFNHYYLTEALRCLDRARFYLAQGFEQTARYACERAVFWYELAR